MVCELGCTTPTVARVVVGGVFVDASVGFALRVAELSVIIGEYKGSTGVACDERLYVPQGNGATGVSCRSERCCRWELHMTTDSGGGQAC